jgi:uncharacterized protein
MTGKNAFLSLTMAMSVWLIPVGRAQDKCASIDSYLASDGYDELAAKRFGANDNGMKKYVIAFLKRGPNRPTDQTKAEELQAAHIKNIQRMAAEGKLVLAGPFMDDGELRGIYVFSVESLEQAEALTKTDPAVKAGSLIMELKEWYGSAALMAVNGIHKKLSRAK